MDRVEEQQDEIQQSLIFRIGTYAYEIAGAGLRRVPVEEAKPELDRYGLDRSERLDVAVL